MRRPRSEMATYPGDERPAWARAVNRAVNKVLDPDAPLYTMLEAIAPATSRLISPLLRTTEEGHLGRYDHLKAVLMVPTMAIDMTLIYASLSLGHSPLEVVAWKLAANAATHIGFDLAELVVNRIRNFRPPVATTFTV